MAYSIKLTRGLVLAPFALLLACSNVNNTAPDNPEPTSKSTPKEQLSASAFPSCTAFRSYYSEALAEEILTQYRYGYCFGCETVGPTAEPPMAMEGDNATAAPGSSRQVTETNTQEAGVDEADIIETNPDGTEIYVLRRYSNELLVIDTANPEQPNIIARIALEGERQARGMFFDRQTKRLAIILEQSYYYLYAGGRGGAPAMAMEDASFAPPAFEQGTEIQFFDVSDPAEPVRTDRFVTDGFYVDARRMDSRLHLVTRFGFPYPTALYEDEEFQRLTWQDYREAYMRKDEAAMQELGTQIRQRIRAAVDAMPIDSLLPAESRQAGSETTLACTAIEAPEVSTRLGLMMISSMDIDGANQTTLGSINNAWNIYASTDNLYLLQGSDGWWFDPGQRQQTAIYRFDLSSGSARAGAVGLVDGWMANSYQLSEWQDHLRVASTEGRYNGPDSRFTQHNHLTVLQVDNMVETGRVEDFVEDNKQETIRSARFIADKGYVVTFEQIDPLFTFDLSDPNNPQRRGKLEIPGFSSYMYPLDDSHLLTIGRSGGADGVGTGPGYQLQIFDVSNLDNPIQLASHVPAMPENAYAYSLAEYDPHAFTYAASAGLLSIPVQISARDSLDALSGFIAYRIDMDAGAEAISEYARIDHKDEPDDSQQGSDCPPNRTPPPQGCATFAPVIYNQPLRSVIISESSLLQTRHTLLTLSDAKLKSLDASQSTPQPLATLEFDAP